jgi:chitodextrinase
VKAFDAAGNRSASSDPACLTIPDTTPPTVPLRVTARASGERVVEVAWESSQDDVGVARYEIQRAGAALLTSTENGTRERGLAPVQRYCYAVRACDAAGNCSPAASEACATTPDLTPPTPPGNFRARARSDVLVDLDWSPSTDEIGVAGYELKRGEKVVAGAQTGLAFPDGGLRPGTEYCWALVAFDAAGNRSTPVQACATTPDLTPPTAPGRPAAVSVSSSQTFVGWDPSTDDVGVVAYEVLRDGAPVAKVSVTRFRDLRLPANRDFCYTVRALDAAGNRSEAGGPACTRTADPSQLASPSDPRGSRLHHGGAAPVGAVGAGGRALPRLREREQARGAHPRRHVQPLRSHGRAGGLLPRVRAGRSGAGIAEVERGLRKAHQGSGHGGLTSLGVPSPRAGAAHRPGSGARAFLATSAAVPGSKAAAPFSSAAE